ncbi:chromosome partitioning protein ParA [bacterium MnTg02]|nr:chromosome partitioning protein ParA [bacterium MnTg02]
MAGSITGQHGLRVIAVANQKGGVGKTTTAINLGTALAAVDERVLIVDLDSQGNASTGLGIDEKMRTISTFDVLVKTATLGQSYINTSIPNLSVAPATRDLAGLESELNNAPNRAYRLRDAIVGLRASQENQPLDERFTYVLIDCPPSLNILTINAMAAADSILVPVQCEFFALEGITQLKETIDFVKGSLNPALEILGVVLTMHDPRTKLAEEVANEVRAFFGEKVYSTLIPRNVRVAEAPSFGKPILLYDYKCAGSQAYIKLAIEIIERERLLGAA